MQAAANIRQAARDERDGYALQAEIAWNEWFWGPDKKRIPRPSDWLQTLWRFFELGLPIGDLLDAIAIACGNPRVDVDHTWRYMCGVAWRRLTELQELAQQQLEWTEGADALVQVDADER